MVGLMQIMIYMLAVYLVFKGVEIFQIGLTAQSNKTSSMIIGVIAIAVAIMAGLVFVFWADEMARSISDRMNSIPQR